MEHSERDAQLLALLEKWWEPPAELIATLPKGGVQLKYLGHSDTSRALTECDPGWTWEPMAFDEAGFPVMHYDAKGNPIGIWGWLTVCGVRRVCYGSCDPGKRDAIKELIGDAIRNGAMRFGVAGALWSKAPGGDEKPPKGKTTPEAVERHLAPVKAPQGSDPDNPEPAAGKEAYDALVKEHGEEIVNGALATHKVARFSELTPAKVKVIQASLIARARLVREQQDREEQLAREKAE